MKSYSTTKLIRFSDGPIPILNSTDSLQKNRNRKLAAKFRFRFLIWQTKIKKRRVYYLDSDLYYAWNKRRQQQDLNLLLRLRKLQSVSVCFEWCYSDCYLFPPHGVYEMRRLLCYRVYLSIYYYTPERRQLLFWKYISSATVYHTLWLKCANFFLVATYWSKVLQNWTI